MAGYVFPLTSGTTETTVSFAYKDTYRNTAGLIGTKHKGIDLTASGSPQVVSTVGGSVYRAVNSSRTGSGSGWGTYVVIYGDDGYYHIYGHMVYGSLAVSQGERIEAGDTLGTMGNTGNSSGAHLHYEIRQNYADTSTLLNPAEFLSIDNTTGPVKINGTGPTQVGVKGSQVNVPYENQSVIAGTEQKGDILFGRRCRVIVSNDDGEALDVSDLHIKFTLQKTYLFDLQYSNIQIYNLSRDSENFILREGTRVTVEAGYEGAYYGQIYSGDIVQAFGYWENGTDFVMQIVAADGERFLNDGFVSYNVTRGLTQRQAADDLASRATVKSQLGSISDGLSQQVLPRGKVYFGFAKDYMQQIAKTSDATFYMDNGEVNIVQASDLNPDRIFKLTPASGLIGTPQQEDMGISGKCLLIPQIRVNKTIMVENQYIQQKPISALGSAGILQAFLGTGSGAFSGADGNATTSGVEMIKEFEGLRLTAYTDSAGVWTIGYGHTGMVDGVTIHRGMTISEAKAVELLNADISRFASAVDGLGLNLTTNQRDALISFAYNCGTGSLQQLCGGRTTAEIAEHITAYCHDAGGNQLDGLKRRRQAELSLFNTPDGERGPNSTSTEIETTNAYQTAFDTSQIYRIATAKYVGDNRGDDWYIEFEAMTQTGYLPSMLSNSSGNAF